MSSRKMVCFVSEKNTCRSIIAEAYLRKLGREHFEAQSFGLNADRVHYLVKEVLAARGVNPNYVFSKNFEVIENQRFQYLVLMQKDLAEQLPTIPGVQETVVWDFPPLALEGSDENQLRQDLNNLCDKIEAQVADFIEKHRQK